MVRRIELIDRLLFQPKAQGLSWLLDDRRFEFLLIDSKQFIDFKFNILTDSNPLGIDIRQRGKMKEDILAKMLASDETKFPVSDDLDYLTNTHGDPITDNLRGSGIRLDTSNTALKYFSTSCHRFCGTSISGGLFGCFSLGLQVFQVRLAVPTSKCFDMELDVL